MRATEAPTATAPPAAPTVNTSASVLTVDLRLISAAGLLSLTMLTPWEMKVSVRLSLSTTPTPAFTAPAPAASPAAAAVAVFLVRVSREMLFTSLMLPLPWMEALVWPSYTTAAALALTPTMAPPRDRVAATMFSYWLAA